MNRKNKHQNNVQAFSFICIICMCKMKIDEEILIEKCRHGDRQSWNTLYNIYAGYLLAVCMRYIPDRERACDILHDSFIKIFSSIEKFKWRGEGSPKAWMTRIVINLALESLRKHDIINESADLDAISENDFIEDNEDDIDKIDADTLMNFIKELPDGYRTVFNLYVFEEKSHKEIASILGITEQTSASQYHRAKARILKRIKEYTNKKKN